MRPKQLNPNLTDEQKRVLFEKGTEEPYSGDLLRNDATGIYSCVNCGTPLFKSSTKYESKTPGLMGRPSFADAIPGAITLVADDRYGMQREEAVCAHCSVHLGHYFDDPIAPSGKHYCINSTGLCFDPERPKDH